MNDNLSLGLDLVMVQWRQDGVERGSSSAVVLPLNAISDRGSKKGESRDSVMSKIALTKKSRLVPPSRGNGSDRRSTGIGRCHRRNVHFPLQNCVFGTHTVPEFMVLRA